MNIKENRMLMKNGIYLKKKIKNIVVGDSGYYHSNNNKILVRDTISKAFKNIEETFSNNNRIAYIESSKRFVKCSTESLKHGLLKTNRHKNYRENSFIVSNVGIILKNALKINETKPTYKYNNGQDIYLSIISDTQGNSYICRIIVNKDKSMLNKIEYIDQLKAIKGIKKERIPCGIPALKAVDVLSTFSLKQKTRNVKKYSSRIKKERIPYGIPTLEVGDTLSIVSLEQLAKEVKFKYSDALPTLLLKKFKITREKTKLSENIVF